VKPDFFAQTPNDQLVDLPISDRQNPAKVLGTLPLCCACFKTIKKTVICKMERAGKTQKRPVICKRRALEQQKPPVICKRCWVLTVADWKIRGGNS